MATIAELAQKSSDVYHVTSSATTTSSALISSLSSRNWQVIAVSTQQNTSYRADGYFGAAYYNTVTHEVVIANRGTDLGHGASTTRPQYF